MMRSVLAWPYLNSRFDTVINESIMALLISHGGFVKACRLLIFFQILQKY